MRFKVILQKNNLRFHFKHARSDVVFSGPTRRKKDTLREYLNAIILK